MSRVIPKAQRKSQETYGVEPLKKRALYVFYPSYHKFSPDPSFNQPSYEILKNKIFFVHLNRSSSQVTEATEKGLKASFAEDVSILRTRLLPQQKDVELEVEFNRLAEEWRVETGMLSLVTQKSTHPAYQRIIGMGQPVIPLILRDLEQKPDHWFWALRAITGDDPVKSEQRGRMKLMAQAWIQWGKEHGYEW